MFNLGIAEIAVIVVVGLLVFGPDKLPKAIKTLTSSVKQLRSAATDATRSLQDAAGWESAETRQTLSDLADLHPKRLMGSILDDSDPGRTTVGKPGAGPGTGSSGAAAAKPVAPVADFDPEAP